MEISVILTTYNWPEALRLTLRSVTRQSRMPDEIIIADDGSGQETARVIEEILKPSSLKWCHVWHEHNGVRQSRIKNLAVKNSRSPYLLFVDHDVVLHPDFVADHLAMAQSGLFLQGKRALLSETFTKKILNDCLFKEPGFWMRGLGNRKNTIRSTALGRLFAGPRNFQTSLRGCNLSMSTADFFKVDGFDETFDGSWGREDSDICYRMFHAGMQVRNLWFLALQYHLHHGGAGNWQRERLDLEIQTNLQERRIAALKGISRISSEGEILAMS